MANIHIKRFEYNGKMLSFTEIMKLPEYINTGMSRSTLYRRLNYKKMTVKKALSKPITQYTSGCPAVTYEYNGEEKPIKTWAKELDINETYLRTYIRHGATVEDAVADRKDHKLLYKFRLAEEKEKEKNKKIRKCDEDFLERSLDDILNHCMHRKETRYGNSRYW